MRIPSLFSQILDDPISAARFSGLLRQAATTSFVGREELEELSVQGLLTLVRSVMATRIVDEWEEDRIRDVADHISADISSDERLEADLGMAKILRELSQGKSPEIVALDGPMPVRMRRAETLIWIFNEVRLYRLADAADRLSGPPPVKASYYTLDEPSEPIPPPGVPAKRRRNVGDLILSNYNIHFVQAGGDQMRIPISRISGLSASADAVSVGYGAHGMVRTFRLDAPGFLVNAIALLVKQLRNRGD